MISRRIKGESIYTPDMDKVVEDILSEGLSMDVAAGKAGINTDTLYAWIDESGEYLKPSLSEAVKRGRTAGNALYERAGRDIMTGELKGNVIAWIFNMKNRYGWQDKREVEHSGEVAMLTFGSDDDDGMETVGEDDK